MARLKASPRDQVEDDVEIDEEDGEVEEAGVMETKHGEGETPLHRMMHQSQLQPFRISPRLLRRVPVPLEEEGIEGEIDGALGGAGEPLQDLRERNLEFLPEQEHNEDLVVI